MLVNDFFCGCGGMGLGFKHAGFEIAGSWDFDKYAVQSYAKNVNEDVKQKDIREMEWQHVPLAQVWTFGFPCQDLSFSGLKAGLYDGKRSKMFFEIMRLLDETEEHKKENMPQIILAENVKGLKPYLDVIKAEYEKRGYTMYYQLYDSKYWGVPQNRERYFLVGVRNTNREFVFPEQPIEYKSSLSDVLEKNAPESSYYPADRQAKILELCAEHIKKINLSADQACIIHNIYGGFKETKARIFEEYSPTIRTAAGGGHIPSVLEYTIEKGFRARKLLPREAARLQGFPDDYQIIVSDTQAFRQFGNAVTVNVAHEVAKAIKNFLEVSAHA